jgi:hypothetical protein
MSTNDVDQAREGLRVTMIANAVTPRDAMAYGAANGLQDATEQDWRSLVGERAATWEGSVLPALRLALDEHPETRGRPVVFGGIDLENDRIVAEIVLADGTRCRTMRRDTAEHIVDDAARVARDMAEVTRMRAAMAAAKPQCPVCQAIAGWAPACTRCRAGAPGGSAVYDPTKVRVTFNGQRLASVDPGIGRDTSGIVTARREPAPVALAQGHVLDAHARLWLGDHEPRRPGETDAELRERIELRIKALYATVPAGMPSLPG